MKIARKYAVYKAYTGERAWKIIRDRLQAPSYLIRVNHNWEIRTRKKRTDFGKFSIENRNITDWNQLTEWEIEALTSNTCSFRKGVRKVITSVAK
jgi:hypothetical protein